MAANKFKKADVQVGVVYIARVSGKLVEVKIMDVLHNQGPKRNMTRWLAKNLSTGREIVIKSAAKLRLKTTSRYTTITPAVAADLLQSVPAENRPASEANVERIALDQKACPNTWKPSDEVL